LLQNNHGVEGELVGDQGKRNVLRVFEAVTYQQRVRVAFAQTAHSQKEFRFGTCLQTEPEGRTEFDDVLYHESVLVAFHWVNSLVMGAVTLRLDCVIKRRLQALQAVLENVREADNEGKLKAEAADRFRIGGLLDNLQQIDLLVRQGGRPVGAHGDVPGCVDGKVGAAPSVDVIESGGEGRRPMASVVVCRRQRNVGKGDRRRKRDVTGKCIAGRWCSIHATSQGRHLLWRRRSK